MLRDREMIFLLASWASFVLALALAWLWLQSAPQRGHSARDDSHARATRTTLRSIAMLAALSAGLLLVHFCVPAREAAADREWVAPRVPAPHVAAANHSRRAASAPSSTSVSGASTPTAPAATARAPHLS